MTVKDLIKYDITDITPQVHYIQAFYFKLNSHTFYLVKNIDAETKFVYGLYRCHCKINGDFFNYKHHLENL